MKTCARSGSFLVLALLSCAALEGGAAELPFAVKAGLFNQSDSADLGLGAAKGTETFTVFKATASSDHYANGVALVGFKGNLYCQWQSSAIHEDSTDTWVAFSRSGDGRTWSAPARIAGPSSADYKTSGGWWVNGDTLVAYVNVWKSATSPRGGNAWYATSLDGQAWSGLKPVLMSDGTAMNGIMEQDPHALPDGRILNAAHFQPGLLAAPIYTDDKSGIRGWRRATYANLSVSGDVSREIEPSWFRRADGTAVMVFRDQTGTYRKLASMSSDRGATWTPAVLTDMPDSRAKQSAGNLPDGTAYQVSNPVDNKRRTPLAITLSKDGKTFDKAYALRTGGSDLQAQRYAGKAKTLGYSYPKSAAWGDFLYAGYATNKEDVQVTRVPLSSLSLVTTSLEQGQRRKVSAIFRDGRLVVEHPGRFSCGIFGTDGRLLASASGEGRIEVGAGLAEGIHLLEVRGQEGTTTLMVSVPRRGGR